MNLHDPRSDVRLLLDGLPERERGPGDLPEQRIARQTIRQETAAMRDFSALYVRFGSFS